MNLTSNFTAFYIAEVFWKHNKQEIHKEKLAVESVFLTFCNFNQKGL